MMMAGIGCIAWKELLHLWRDKRLLAIIFILPPLITALLGNAFEVTDLKDVPVLLDDQDRSVESQDFAKILHRDDTFRLVDEHYPGNQPQILPRRGLEGIIVIPSGWGDSLETSKPRHLELTLDGSDTTTAPYLQGEIEKNLGDFQTNHIQNLIGTLPEDSLNILAQLPKATREQLKGQAIRWSDETTIPFNPKLRFIEYVVPGIIGLVLQLVTVTLTSCTIVRERENGSFSQLSLTPLRFSDIVMGKIVPYLFLSLLLTLEVGLTAQWEFHLVFHHWGWLLLNACLFILFSLNLGLFISTLARTQTQAMQLSMFLLLPILILSGAFAPVSQLPPLVQMLSSFFPLTHYCHAFRLIDIYNASPSLIFGDLLVLLGGAIFLLLASTQLLRRS